MAVSVFYRGARTWLAPTGYLMVLTLLPLALGCGAGNNLAQVTGTVTYEGKPIEEGKIIFEVPGQRSAFGVIENGKILNVTTFEQGDGAPIGEASVAINAFKPPAKPQKDAPTSTSAPGGPSGMVINERAVPARYGNPATSGLNCSIQPGENKLKFDLSK